jgi:hypothetical protein
MQAFTVTMPGGIKDLDYEAYVRLLDQAGIDVTDMPRILERGKPNRWLYAWTERADAERFVKELRKATRNKSWRVHEFHAAHLSRGPLGPGQGQVGCQRSGCTYGLHPHSADLVRKKYPRTRLVPSVFIGNDREKDFAWEQQEPSWDHVAQILTGLSKDELEQLGGYRVYDPVREEVLREPDVPAAPMMAKANAGS